jgi:hypothetical protein
MYIGKLEEGKIPLGNYFKDVFISILLNVISFYTIYFIVPRIVKYSKKTAMVGLILITIGLLVGLRIEISYYFWKLTGNIPKEELVVGWPWVWNELRLVIITGIYAVLIYYFIKAIENEKFRSELVQQRQAGELALLKSQVNPHFLFNTLNNIYSLVYQKSDEAPEAVMKFSSIMRDVLYDSRAETVMLDKEIEYLVSYIELQKLRIREPDFVSLSVEGSCEGLAIAPMLLIPFVENAFKHAGKDKVPAITVSLFSDRHLIRFEVSNCKQTDVQVIEKPFSGVGIENIRRRLDLIYPGRHYLEINEENNQFKIKLEIQP